MNARVIGELDLWMDDEERDGPSNMAIDEWLLGSAEVPVLRVYRWQPGWGSFGYFVPANEAAASLPGLQRVRRWTGGGIVDHRADWTYTLVLPKISELAQARGGESYRLVHRALAEALRAGGVEVVLAGEAPPSRGGDCFVQPAEHDLMDGSGRKLAGAGQRRSKTGLLHQGSVAMKAGRELAERLGHSLADELRERTFSPERELIRASVAARYGREAWASRR